MSKNPHSKLFDRPGYIPLKEYVEDILYMQKNGPWKIPLRFGDRLQFFFLKIIIKFSWFADTLYILHTSSVSPAYMTLFSYVRKKQFCDSMMERNFHLHGYFSYFLEKKVPINGHVRSISGQGVAKDRATAFSIALGEMIERMISGFYDMNKSTVIVSPDELMKKYPIVYPPRYHRFLDVQKKKFKELRHDPTKKIAWVKGKNLVSGERTYIPRQMTSWFGGNNKKDVFVQTTTNGAAGYFTKTGGVLRGLLEVVQRDAFLVHWLTMIPPRIIKQETLPKEIQEKIQEFESFGISLYILNTTSLPIPSVCIAAINAQSEVPQVVVSAATAVTFEEAIQHALKEIVKTTGMFYYEENEAQLKMSSSRNFEPFVSDFWQIGRQLYWRGIEKMKHFSWFISGERVSYSDVCQGDIRCSTDDLDRLRKCLAVLQKLGADYYPVVYYPENIVQKEIGFFVAQVFIPKAFPLYLSEGYGTFESDRLQEFALSRGVSDWKLNPLPHMFS